MQTVNLQIIPNGVLPRVNVSQFDVGRQIQFKLYDGASAYTIPTGTQVRVDGIKPDKHGFSYDATWSGNTVTVTTTEQMTVLNGDIPCELRLIKDSQNIGTLNFVLAVEKSPIDGDTDISDTEIPAIIELATVQMENAEAWATGEKNGVPVVDTEPQYENNSKYYSEQSASSASASANSATASANSATASENSATASANSAVLSESWAVGNTGTRAGEDTNNSWYWCQKALANVQEINQYFALIRLLLSNLYLSTEDDNRIITEDGNYLVIDY